MRKTNFDLNIWSKMFDRFKQTCLDVSAAS